MLSIDLRGPRLHVRRARIEDAAASYQWFANPAVTAYLPLAGGGGIPLQDIEVYLARVAATDRPELAVGIDLIGQGPVGCGGFRNFASDAAELSLVLGEPSTGDRAWGLKRYSCCSRWPSSSWGWRGCGSSFARTTS